MSQAVQQIPKSFGRYKVIREVGVGGLGRVYKATDTETGKTVAIKVLHDRYANDKKFLGIFHRELMIAGGLHHKHIVGYIDSYFQPPLCFIVTDFVDGWSGYQFLKYCKRVPPLVALSIVFDMLQGIDHLHLHDIVHSDLSSANYMLDKSGRVFVMDFGLSCFNEIEDYKNYMIGTPGFHSPEHVSSVPIGPHTDFYCVGILLFEMMTGVKPVPSNKDRRVVLKNMKNINFKLVESSDRKLKFYMKKFLKKSLEFKYQKRYPSADLMMLASYEILKKFNIRYARYAIKQYLTDQKLINEPFDGPKQDIYKGSI